MATGPLGTDPADSLRSERDVLARRCADAEEQIQRLTTELEQARAQLAAYESEGTAGISLLSGQPASSDRLTGDGSDPRVLSLFLAATAVVAAMVAFLALVNGKLGTPFGVVMVLLTIGLVWGAARSRVVPVEVSVVRGVVYVVQGEASHRFDLRKEHTQVQMVGQPDDPGWSVRFPRRHMEPVVIDRTMVDPHDFVWQLREYRPQL
ncbi:MULTISPECIES: hypothetical protein [Nocardioides]|uniref:Uncharacterized protein n=1 Tax=Nocardioides vastitatis TaxID=2568655 RepID=A0ABW0Z9C2_9ACTN|nr:hypothetical protein [Nocardioides sp.]THJ02349.1 hypothetical protein E7Z54_10435 [Nocardioides sp.]